MDHLRKLSPTDPIELLNLNVRVYNALKRASVNEIGELVALVEAGNLLDVRNIGEKSAREVRQALARVTIVGAEPVVEALDPQVVEKTLLVETVPLDAIEWLKDLARRQISIGLLHEQARIGGEPVSDWLAKIYDVDRRTAYDTMTSIIGGSLNICDELEVLLDRIPREDYALVLVSRYGCHSSTLEEVGTKIGVTRERVRQLGKRLERIVSGEAKRLLEVKPHFTNGRTLLRIQTALLIAKDMSLDITYENWSQRILRSGLMGDWTCDRFAGFDPFETMIAICNLLAQCEIDALRIPTNLEYAIKLAASGSPDLPARVLHIRKTLPKAVKKLVRRHARFSGGVDARWLSFEVKKGLAETKEMLRALGYRSVLNDWFVPRPRGRSSHIGAHDVFHHALRKMFQHCGSLSIEDICFGMRPAISRTRYPVPPPEVMTKMMEMSGYKVEEGLWYWDGEMHEEMSRGEAIIRDCLKEHGPVVHHSELVEAFLESDLSLASLHGTLQRSPLFDRIDKALYKLRGASPSQEDIERAAAAGDRIPVDPEVRYDTMGNVIVSANVSATVIGFGTLISEHFPNLTGDWDCYVQDRRFGTLAATESEFRDLSDPLEYLGCEAGDRVRFTFNTWDRTVTIERVQD